MEGIRVCLLTSRHWGGGGGALGSCWALEVADGIMELSRRMLQVSEGVLLWIPYTQHSNGLLKLVSSKH